MQLLNEPVQFTREQLDKIEEVRKCKWLIDTENPKYSNVIMSIFYSDEPHPLSNSRYFALYYKHVTSRTHPDGENTLMITDGTWVEELDIDAVEAENGDVIFSRYRHDYRTSPDGSVFIDGGRAYTRTSADNTKWRTVKVKDGQVVLS